MAAETNGLQEREAANMMTVRIAEAFADAGEKNAAVWRES